jgi:hypothetical protein
MQLSYGTVRKKKGDEKMLDNFTFKSRLILSFGFVLTLLGVLVGLNFMSSRQAVLNRPGF